MKPEQKIAGIFTAFGFIMGVFSVISGSNALSAIIPIALYIALMFFVGKQFKEKKEKWVIINSIIPFLFIWFISWVTLFNVVA